MRAVLKNGRAQISSSGSLINSDCPGECCDGCTIWHRYRVCGQADEGCSPDELDYYFCTIHKCNGQPVNGRTVYMPSARKCFYRYDTIEYVRGTVEPGQVLLPANALTIPTSEPVQCVDDCNTPPCPPRQMAAPGAYCVPDPSKPPVWACLNWLTRCGVYNTGDAYGCAKFDPAAAKPIHEILAADPTARILTNPPSVRSNGCCGCGSGCPGGDYTVGPFCAGGSTWNARCCHSLRDCGALAGSLQVHAVLVGVETYLEGTVTTRTTYDGHGATGLDCVYEGSGTRHVTVDRTFGANPGRDVDVTTNDTGPGGPVVGPPVLFPYIPSQWAPWSCSPDATLSVTQVGCGNFQYTARLVVLAPGGRSTILTASVVITQQVGPGSDGNHCADECGKGGTPTPTSGDSAGGCAGCGGGPETPPEILGILGEA